MFDIQMAVESKKEKLPLTVTATQSTLHSIGEGVVTTACSYAYKIINGSVSVLETAIDDRVRILGVDGKGIQSCVLCSLCLSTDFICIFDMFHWIYDLLCPTGMQRWD